MITFEARVAVGIDGTATVMTLGTEPQVCDVAEDIKDLGASEWVDWLKNESKQVKACLSSPGIYLIVGCARPSDDSMNYSHLQASQIMTDCVIRVFSVAGMAIRHPGSFGAPAPANKGHDQHV